MMTKRAIVLWTGGKDSCLSLHLAKEENYDIVGLATFVPVGNPTFKAHPQPEMSSQAKRLNIPLTFFEVTDPYKESYIESLQKMKTELKVTTIITGDIDLVAGHPNWVEECCNKIGLICYRPLWLKPRDWVLQELINRNIQVRITYMNDTRFPSSWLNRIIDEEFLKELKQASVDLGFDLAGENGEYHTMVINCPLFIE